MVKGALAQRARSDRGRAAARPGARARRSPRTATCRCSTAIDPLGRPRARRQRGPDPRRWSTSAPAGCCAGPGSTRSSPTRSSTACASSSPTWPIDPDHPLRAKAEEGARQARRRPPARSGDARARSRRCKSEHARQPGGRRLARRACGRRAAPALLRAARDPDAALGRQARRGAAPARRRRCSSDPALAAAINRFARRAAVGIAAAMATDRQAGLRDGPRLGRAAPSPTGWKTRSAATCNISASTARWSAAWSASSSTRSMC